RAGGRRLPDAAVGGADVEDRRVWFVDREIGDASRHARGSDRSEMQTVERTAGGARRWRLLRDADERLARERGDNDKSKREEAVRLHGELSRVGGNVGADVCVGPDEQRCPTVGTRL